MKNSKIEVLKFGGTSMGSADTMVEACKVIKEKLDSKKQPFVVVSAVSKMTDALVKLLDLAKNNKRKDFENLFNLLMEKHLEILNNLTKNEILIEKYTDLLEKKLSSLLQILNGIFFLKDYSEKIYSLVLSYGEDLSSDLMELCLIENNVKAKKIHSKKLVKTQGSFLSADVDFKKTKTAFSKIKKEINDGVVFIMTGFFGSNSNNEIMLLGRGGSDFSGSIAGISLDAKIVEIWTDADGIMSADPRIIKDAKLWEKLNKDIASEMARAGAKVLHPKTISASFYNIDILIKNLFNKNSVGTLINSLNYGDGVRGIVSDSNYSILHLENQDMFGNTGFIAEIGLIASENNIPLDMSTTSETSVSFTVKTSDINNEALKLFSSIATSTLIEGLAKISIIGGNIVKNEILENIFTTLKKENIEPLMVSVGYSQNNIGVIVKEEYKEKALNILHMNLIF